MDERDIPKKPVKSRTARYGHGQEYHDWDCPHCRQFVMFEPAWRKIPNRCPHCGQLLKGIGREEAEADPEPELPKWIEIF